MTKSWFKTRKK